MTTFYFFLIIFLVCVFIALCCLFCLCIYFCLNRGRPGNPATSSDIEPGLEMSSVRRTVGSGAERGDRRLTDPVIIDGKLYGQDYKRIKSCLRTLFVDEKFPADKYSISYDGRLNGQDVDTLVDDWVRAGRLYPHPEMIKDGVAMDDVIQGHLGDCWMLASMAALSERPSLFKHVVPPGQSFSKEYTGLFLFRLWWYGEWVEVVVDDLIPVNNERRPVFVHSRSRGEMWPCLLEKAYAKLAGSYYHLAGGIPMSAMVDFTGGFPKRFGGAWDLKSVDSGGLFADLKKVFEKSDLASGGLVCAGTRPGLSLNGLVGPHAYTVCGVLEQDLTTRRPRLVKMRNPWGRGEWTGEWSKDWIRRNRKESSLLETGPGEFLIKLDDFLSNFRLLEICYILNSDWEERIKRSELTPVCRMREVGLTLNQAAETMICFSQIGRRQLRDEMGTKKTHLGIKLMVWKISDQGLQIVLDQNFEQLRTRTTSHNLTKGRYRILAQADRVDFNTGTLLRVASRDKNFKIY